MLYIYIYIYIENKRRYVRHTVVSIRIKYESFETL